MGKHWPIEIQATLKSSNKHSNVNVHQKHQDFAENGRTMAYRNVQIFKCKCSTKTSGFCGQWENNGV